MQKLCERSKPTCNKHIANKWRKDTIRFLNKITGDLKTHCPHTFNRSEENWHSRSRWAKQKNKLTHGSKFQRLLLYTMFTSVTNEFLCYSFLFVFSPLTWKVHKKLYERKYFLLDTVCWPWWLYRFGLSYGMIRHA